MTHTGVYDVYGYEMPLVQTGYWLIPLSIAASQNNTTAYGPYRTPQEAHAVDDGGCETAIVVYATLTIDRVHSVCEYTPYTGEPIKLETADGVALSAVGNHPIPGFYPSDEYKHAMATTGMPPGWTKIES